MIAVKILTIAALITGTYKLGLQVSNQVQKFKNKKLRIYSIRKVKILLKY